MMPPWLKDSVAPLLAIIVVVGGFIMMYVRPEQKTEIAGMMTMVLMFFFGSSRGSQNKDDLIAKLPPRVNGKDCCKDKPEG